MALTDSHRLSALALLVAPFLAIACTPAQSSNTPAHAEELSLEVPVKRDGFDTVVVFLPLDVKVKPVWTTLRDELSAEFDVIPVPVSESSTVDDFARALVEHSPKCVVLFDNKTTSLYARYQASSGQQSFPPAVILLTSYATLYSKVKHAVGIAYEVPLVISATRLRSYIAGPLDRVGVVHRKVFRSYVDEQAELARVEQIEVLAAEVPNDTSPKDLADALATLGGRIDALWVLNDNALLTPEHIRDGWLPRLAKMPVPTIVGIRGLVTREVQFGTFAVVPDLTALGVQSANLIYDLADADWQIVEGQAIEQPLSVQTVLDVERARDHFDFKEEMLGEISEVAK